MAFSYEKQPFIDVDHTHGASVTGLAHKIVLNANNFDFSQVRSDLFDVQFADADGDVLPHYLYHYDVANNQAVFFVKMDLHAGEIKPITLRWGDPTIAVDPSDTTVCLYANRLATQADLDDLTEVSSNITAAIVADANAPTGNAVELTVNASDGTLMRDLTLPDTYEAWLMETETIGSGAYPAPLVEASDDQNYYRIGRWDGVGTGQVRRILAGAAQNFSTNLAPPEYPPAGEYIMQQTLVGPARRFVELSDFILGGLGGAPQGLAYHQDFGLFFTKSPRIGLRNVTTGTTEETYSPSSTPSGQSWGDAQVADLKDGNGFRLFVAQFDGVAPNTSQIYWFDPNNLNGGPTLFADITQHIPTTDSINALTYDPNKERWLVGVTRSAYLRCDFYEFSKDFSVAYGRIDSHEGDWGFQGSDFSRGILHTSEHSASSSQGRTLWQTYAIDESARMGHPSHALWPQMGNGQGIAYDAERDVWYVIKREGNPHLILIMRLDVDDTQRMITGRWGYNSRSIGSVSLQDQSPPAPQSKVGIGAYRDCRVTNLAYIKTTSPLPVNRLPVSSNSAVFPTPSEVVSVGDTQHVVSV